MPPRLQRVRAAAVNPEPAVAAAFDAVIAGLGSKQSRIGYEKDWVAWRQWLAEKKVDVLAATAGDVKRYVGDILAAGKSKATRARALSVLREVYREMVSDGLLSTNPAREVKNPKHGGTHRTPWLEVADLAKILGYQGSSWREWRDRMCVQLLACTGWRRSEVARMRAEDFENGRVRGIVKGGKEEVTKVAGWLLDEIEAWKEFAAIERGPLLPRSQKDRKAVSGDIVYKSVHRVARAVGVSVSSATPHSLRRTMATEAEKRGVPLADIQQALGHASRNTTERYLKGSREVAAAPGEWMGELVKKREGT